MGYVKTEIKTLLSELLACPVEDIADDRALEELGLDSLQFVSAIVAIEEFQRRIIDMQDFGKVLLWGTNAALQMYYHRL